MVAEIVIEVDGEPLGEPIVVPQDGDFHTVLLTVQPYSESVEVEVDGLVVLPEPVE